MMSTAVLKKKDRKSRKWTKSFIDFAVAEVDSPNPLPDSISDLDYAPLPDTIPIQDSLSDVPPMLDDEPPTLDFIPDSESVPGIFAIKEEPSYERFKQGMVHEGHLHWRVKNVVLMTDVNPKNGSLKKKKRPEDVEDPEREEDKEEGGEEI